MSRAALFLLPALAAVAAVASCGPEPSTTEEPAPTLTGEALQDPNNCRPCHEQHVREWSGSMHAYAGDDPVFLAMNQRMQRETNGAAGDFCVACHAPMAVRTGKTKDGTNLAQLPSSLRGVTCIFCHEASAVEGDHNNPVKLAGDGRMRGSFGDPAKSSPHLAGRSPLHDREDPASATLCGACHDVVTPHGAHVERTFEEWKASLYAKPANAAGQTAQGQLACGKCHMSGRNDVAAQAPGVSLRTVHDHTMAAVDVALTPFPEADDQRKRVQELLDGAIIAKLCVQQNPTGPTAEVSLDNAFAGHSFPSGANQDRRAWVELVATRDGQVVFSSGAVPDKKPAESLSDPNLLLLRDKIFDDAGNETHLFWQAARTEPSQLPPAVTSDPLDPAFYHAVKRSYPLPLPLPDRITMRVRFRPLDYALLDDLVASGDLAPEVRDRVPTFDLASTAKEWTKDRGFGCVP